MASESYPNANHNSGAVTTAEYEQMVAAGLGTGLVGTPADTAVVYADSSGRQVKIRSGKRAVVRGSAWYSGGSDITVPISANASGSTRIDRIVLRLTKASGEITEEVVEGTPGAGTPVLTRDLGTSGYYEFPLARVTVANGAATLADDTVDLDGWYLAAQPVTGVTTTLPAAADQSPGMLVYDSQADEAFISTGGTLHTLYADSDWVPLTAASGWSASSLAYRHMSGHVSFVCEMTRTGASMAPSSLSRLATIPAGFRPTRNWRATAYIQGGHIGLIRIATTGAVELTAFASTTFATGDTLNMGATTWPI